MTADRDIRGIVFDFDGTLAELTIDFHMMKKRLAATARAMEVECEEPGTTPALEWVEEIVAGAMDSCRDTALELGSRCRLVIVSMELDAARSGRLFDFTRPLLGALRTQGLGVAVLTRNCTPAVTAVFPDLMDHCDVFLPREEAPRVKPDPAHLEKALEMLGLSPKNALVVGDHPLDVESAGNVGAMSAAVASGHTPREDLAAAKPDYLAGDAGELFRDLGLWKNRK